MPTLQELQALQHTTKQINIIESIAAKWEGVALQLSIGKNRIDIIRCNSPHDVEKACRRMLGWWLDTERDRATWRRLISALKVNRLFALAHDIEKALE